MKFESKYILTNFITVPTIILFIFSTLWLFDDMIYEKLHPRLKNIENIEAIIQDDYNIGTKDYEVRYYNDKYIFIEYKNYARNEYNVKTKKKSLDVFRNDILILKFDDLFKVRKVEEINEKNTILTDSIIQKTDSIKPINRN